MNKETIYIKNKGNVDITPNDIITINSTHVDKPTRVYEIWKDCVIENNSVDLFVIRNHNPWVDINIINDKELTKKILDYTQDENNKITKK